MRVLLDENVHVKLRHLFEEDTVAETVRYRGWDSLENGELLRAAEAEYDAFVTMDHGIPHQHKVASLDLALVIIRAPSSEYDVVAPLMPAVCKALKDTRPGTVASVE